MPMLRDLDLDEISLVDRGANEDARVVLFKRAVDIGTFEKMEGVQFVIGFKQEGGSEVQSVLFDSKIWDKEKAKAWLKDHDFSSAKLDETENRLRYRQHEPDGYKRLRTITPGMNKQETKKQDGLLAARLRAALLKSRLTLRGV